ncbi:MAG: carboxypeptidase regulatory-like domain-containing protein [Myxococcales bacterium]|nr:carboxypeptidase regulatory-like domain-containing protein [Myxococcales bacterium]
MRRPPLTLPYLLCGLLAVLGLACGTTPRRLAPPEPHPTRVAPAPRDSVAPPPISLTASDGSGLALASFRARAVVEDPLALTELELSFDNPQGIPVEGQFEILIPPGARVTRFAMWQDGTWREAEVVERQHARQTYEAFVHEGRDPALLERDTGNRFRARVFPIDPYERKRLVLSYTQELADPGAPFRLLTKGLPWLESLDAEVMLLDPEGGPPRVERFGLSADQPGRDLVVPRAAPPVGGIRRGEHVVARVIPLAEAAAVTPRPFHRLTVLLDTSASRALDYDASVEALGRLVRRVARDASTARLELLAFDQGVVPVYEGPIGGFGAQALADLHGRRPLGASDLEGALRALGERERERVLLVSDGLISAGSESNAELSRAVAALGRHGVERVDVLAVGQVRDDARLQRLVTTLPDSGVVLDGEAPAEDSARRMLQPTFDGVHIDVPGASWWRPRRLDGVQPGDAVLVHAELPPERELVVQVSGPLHTEHTVPLRDGGSPLVDHAWMNGRIESLVERVESLQDALESERLRSLAVSLSVRHRILNDLTAMLVLDTDEDYARFGLDLRAPADILVVGDDGAMLEHRGPEPEPIVEPEPEVTDANGPEARPSGGSISGRVTNSETKEPIQDALVILQCTCLNGTREAGTSDNGLYRFDRLPPGTYTIQVLAGQADVSKVTTLPAGARFRANFSVDPQQEFLRAIRVQTRAEHRRESRRDRRDRSKEVDQDAVPDDYARRPTNVDVPRAPPPPVREAPVAAPPPPPPPPQAQPSSTVQMEEFENIPVGNATSRDFTQVVESSATASRDSAGISLAGTTGAESRFTVEGANVNSPSFGTIGGSGTYGYNMGPRYAKVLIQQTGVRGEGPERHQARVALRTRTDALERCYYLALQRDDRLWGRVRIELRLDEHGTVDRVAKRWQVGLDDDELLRCVDRSLQETGFMMEEGRHARVLTTLIFTPYDGVPPEFDPSRALPPTVPVAPEPSTAQVAQALAGGHLREAWALAWAWRERSPTDLRALVALGEVARAAGNPELAARAYGSILDLHPSQAPIRRFAASELLALDFEDARALAIDALTKAVAQRPDHPSSHRDLAMARLRSGQPREAFEALAEGLRRGYAPGRFEGAHQVMREDLGIVAAAWIAAHPTDAPQVEDALRELGATVATAPSLRFVMSWETDANDVDLWVEDGQGNHATPEQPALATGGAFVTDVVNGYGPEAFSIAGEPAAFPYRLRVSYYDRGPMGFAMGRVQVMHHDGHGGVVVRDRPFVLVDEGGVLDLGPVWPPSE